MCTAQFCNNIARTVYRFKSYHCHSSFQIRRKIASIASIIYQYKYYEYTHECNIVLKKSNKLANENRDDTRTHMPSMNNKC